MEDDMTMHVCDRCGGMRKAKYAQSESDNDCLLCIKQEDVTEW